ALDLNKPSLGNLAHKVYRGVDRAEQRLATVEFKKAIKQDIMSHGEEPHHSKGCRLKYILEGTIQTNGQQAKVLPDQAAVERLLPGQSEFIVAAVDPGAKKTACSAKIDTLDPDHVSIVDIPRINLPFAEELYRKRLEHAKQNMIYDDKAIHTVERELVKFTLPPPP
ncbi:hypothetical protein BGW38_007389, partial [Lunasporangiospora selenospora]